MIDIIGGEYVVVEVDRCGLFQRDECFSGSRGGVRPTYH